MQIALNTPSIAAAARCRASWRAHRRPRRQPTLSTITRSSAATAPWCRSSRTRSPSRMMKAFLAVHGTQGAASASVREVVDVLTQTVMRALMRSRPGGGTFHIEDVQDQVELGLMRGGHHEIARAYVLYRERRTQERAKQTTPGRSPQPPCCMSSTAAQRVPLDLDQLKSLIDRRLRRLGQRHPARARSWPRPCATCMTASRWKRCTRPPSWRPAP